MRNVERQVRRNEEELLNMMLWWTFRILLVVTCVLGLIMSAGCTMPEFRVKTVHITDPPTADVVVRWKGKELAVSVAVEKLSYEIPAPEDD